MKGKDGPVVPEYRLLLDVDFDGLRWSGHLEFDVSGDGERLELDCEGLDVRSVRAGGAPVEFAYDRTAHRLAFGLPPGRPAPIAVDFAGTVETKNLFGLYRSRQGDAYVLTTHCEPTGARRIFPCLDRPDRKARIVLTVRAPAGLQVISNTPVRSTRPVDGRAEWAFEPTPEMSTYLLYLGIGQFDFREDRDGPVTIRVATAPGRGEAADWALRSARRILAAYEAYYGIPYPLPKLDLIAVAEHSFGAMENWGAISFQESRLLIDGASSTFSTHDVFTVTAHEIAHQWFGNLVTMSSWDDIWLNESFAALMETKITDALEPSFAPWDDFVLRNMGKAMGLDGDSLRSTHPVRSHVGRPDELSQIFDEISYGKGSGVLAMLDAYLGEERFRSGVTEYLRTFRYGNARTEDLFAALARASGEPVGALAGPWIDRPGLPLVTARAGPRGIDLAQRRFGYHDVAAEAPWPIPMVIEVDGRTERLLLDTRERHLDLPPGATVLLNSGSVGFYRGLYDPELLDRLLAVLPRKSGRDAWAVVDDLAAFVLGGEVDWATYGRLADALSGSTDRLVVETLASSLAAFALEFGDVEAVGGVARRFLARQSERIGVDRRPGEPAGQGILRDRVAFARVRIDRSFAAELAPRFASWDRLDPDLRTAVAIAKVRADGAGGYDAVRAALRGARSDLDAARLARGLAWSDEPARVRELLDLALTGEINRSHVWMIAGQAASNPAGRAETWAWLRANLDRLTEMFRGSGYLPIVLELTLPLVGVGRAAEVRRFFDGRPVPEGTRGLAKGLERLELAERLGRRLS